jgi:signal peptidase I
VRHGKFETPKKQRGKFDAENNVMNKNEASLSADRSVLLYFHDVVYLLATVLLLFSLVFRVMTVSGPSMNGTLINGDCVLLLGNLIYRQPEYGDIIVASKDSFEDGEPIIKRVIATEGQVVDIDFNAGIVYVDGVALKEDYTYTPTTLQEGMTFPLVVEEGCIFVMGDNRNNSKDSRSPQIGLIDLREVMGRAIFLMIPAADSNGERQLDRIGVL